MSNITDVKLDLQRVNLHKDIRGHSSSEVLSTKHHPESRLKFIVIPGNPGMVQFYTEFIKTLYVALGSQHDVIGISHLGHCGRIEEQFTLEEQIEHKVIFLQHLLHTRFNGQPNVEFVLIGHSVGSYISLKLTQRHGTTLNIVKEVNLFPTFRNLYEGLSPMIKVAVQDRFRGIVANILNVVPAFVTRTVMSVIMPQSTDEFNVNYWSASNILFMAHDETREICELDDECKSLFGSRLDDLLFIYGTSDPYTPKSFFEDLVAAYPSGNIEYAPEGVPHAFVLSHAPLVATRVAAWLEEKLSITRSS
eukprot:gene208-252_t